MSQGICEGQVREDKVKARVLASSNCSRATHCCYSYRGATQSPSEELHKIIYLPVAQCLLNRGVSIVLYSSPDGQQSVDTILLGRVYSLNLVLALDWECWETVAVVHMGGPQYVQAEYPLSQC